jgi:hypothetical protein
MPSILPRDGRDGWRYSDMATQPACKPWRDILVARAEAFVTVAGFGYLTSPEAHGERP